MKPARTSLVAGWLGLCLAVAAASAAPQAPAPGPSDAAAWLLAPQVCATVAADEPTLWEKYFQREEPEKPIIDCHDPKNFFCWECDRQQDTFCCRHECDVLCRRDEKGYCIPG